MNRLNKICKLDEKKHTNTGYEKKNKVFIHAGYLFNTKILFKTRTEKARVYVR